MDRDHQKQNGVNFMVQKEILVILLNWNGTADTLECLESLRRSPLSHFDVVIVENGSREEEVRRLKDALKGEVLLESKENLGFAGGNNLALRYGLGRGYRYFFLLNNDTHIGTDCLFRLKEAAHSDPQIGIVGAVNYYAADPGRVWYSGGRLDWRTGQPVDETAEADDLSPFPLLREVDDVSGSSLFVKREVLEKVGLLEPKYFAYYEETEWCLKAKRAGYKVVACLAAKVWHKVSRTLPPPGVQYMMTRNRCLFMLRNAPKAALVAFLYRELREGISLWLKRSRLDGIQYARLAAYQDVLRRRWGKGQMERFMR